MAETRFTTNEFLAQVGEFRKLMGDKSFMEGPEEKRDIAVKALHYAYLLTRGEKEDMDMCATILLSTIEEYGRRLAFITVRPLRQALGLNEAFPPGSVNPPKPTHTKTDLHPYVKKTLATRGSWR